MLVVSMLVASVFAVPLAVTTTDTAEEAMPSETNTAVLLSILGEGTEEDPFLIETEEDLRLVSDFNDCYFKLANDIVLTDTDWEPLCVLTTPFSGTFDGDGHTIFGLTISTNRTDTTGYYNGLFSRNAGTIKNLNVVTSESGITGCSFYVGVLAGYNSGIIENCRVSGTINNKYSASFASGVGGLVGKNSDAGLISKTYSDVSVISASTGTLYSGDRRYIGGIVGYNSGNVDKSFYEGLLDVAGTDCYECFVGGLVGYQQSTATNVNPVVTDSAAVSTIETSSNSYYYSGLIGGTLYTTSSKITNCYAITNAEKLDKGLGFFGYTGGSSTPRSTVTNSFYDKDVSGLIDTGFGEPKTTAAMKMKATFTRAGWDFENTWGISEDINDGYPYLLWMYDEEKPNSEISFNTSMQAYLNLEGLITMSVGYKFDDMTSINPEEYVNRVGLLVWDAENAPEEAEAVFSNCTNVIKNTKYNSYMSRFETTTDGIVARKLGDQLAFRPYFVNDDGSYTYGRYIESYSPKTYCYNQINQKPDDEKTIGLMASILNYGAAAQIYFDYKTDDLMNSDLPEELK